MRGGVVLNCRYPARMAVTGTKRFFPSQTPIINSLVSTLYFVRRQPFINCVFSIFVLWLCNYILYSINYTNERLCCRRFFLSFPNAIVSSTSRIISTDTGTISPLRSVHFVQFCFFLNISKRQPVCTIVFTCFRHLVWRCSTRCFCVFWLLFV